MKNKGLVTKSLVMATLWNTLRASRPEPGGLSLGCDTRQAVHLLVLTLALFMLLPVPLLCAEETGALLEQISFDRESSSRETVTFKLNGPHIPKIFAMKGEAPKVVFDFYDTRHSTSIKAVMKSRGNLVSAIRTGMHAAPQLKTRVVLDLAPGSDYDFAQDFNIKDNALKITIFHTRKNKAQQERKQKQAEGETKKANVVPAKVPPSPEVMKKKAISVQQVEEKRITPPPAVSPSTSPVVAVKKPVSSSQLLIHAVSFEQSPDKGDKVSFQLSNFHPPVVFGNEEGTPSIVCDFLDSGLGDEVPELISAKGKFVKQIRLEKGVNPSRIRAVLELVPNRHYDLQQVFFKEENLYVLFVNSPDTAGAGSAGKP